MKSLEYSQSPGPEVPMAGEDGLTSTELAAVMAFVSRYMSAWNRRDASALLALMCPEVRYVDEAWDEALTRDELAEELADYFDSYEYHFELRGNVFCNGNQLAFRYFGKLTQPSGNEMTLRGAYFMTLRDGLAIEIRDYYQQPEETTERHDGDSGGQYVKSGLNREAMADLLAKIEEAMRRDKLYLDPTLSLPKLAGHLEASVNHVSQAINAGLNTNFVHFVNRNRVEASLGILESDTLPPLSTHEVASAVGFNSTSTFYSAFQKVFGMTPGAYRRQKR